MQFGRSFWAIPVLAVLSAPVVSLSAMFDDDEPVVTPTSVSLASAPTVEFYLSAPLVQGTFQPGATVETFDTMPLGVTNSAVLAIGTVTGGSICAYAAGPFGGAITSSATPVSPGGVGTRYASPRTNCNQHLTTDSVTISVTTPVNYFGFYWTAGDASNQITLLSGGQVVASFTASDLMNLINSNALAPINGGSSYASADYLYNPRYLQSPNNSDLQNGYPGYPFAYVHAVITGGAFDQIRMTAASFEFDNLATASLSATFNPTGLVSVPLNSYAITYDAQGGSSVSPGLYTAGSTVTLAAPPTRAGYEFLGWGTTSVGTPLGSSYAPSGTGAITLFAQWAPMVTFDANGATGANATQSARGNTALRANTFTRSGFTFAGWNTTISGTGTSYADGATFNFTTPTTLYAQWTVASNPAAPQLPLVTLPVTTAAPITTAPSTTTPATTVPATTTPSTPTTTTVPAPIAEISGELPAMQPGESLITDNGTPVPVEVFFEETNTLVMRGQDFELNLAGQCDEGCDLTTDSTGREVLQVQQDGNAFVNGFGFMPGTLVHIWMFSEPTYLGSLLVADDGTFQGSVYLEGIAPGTHTLQVNGTSFDGNDRSANLGVIVTANTDPSVPLPVTGGNTASQLVLAALAMVMLGVLTRRRA